MVTSEVKLRSYPSTSECGREEAAESDDDNVRGVGWVLRWAAAIGVLTATAVLLLDFGYRLAAEQAMYRAATAGIREAAMPRATRHTIEQSIRRDLSGHFRLGSETSIALGSGGKTAKGVVAGRASDLLSVSLSAPADAALPSWLQALSPWSGHAVVVSHVGPAG
jgi:hypothetical protein